MGLRIILLLSLFWSLLTTSAPPKPNLTAAIKKYRETVALQQSTPNPTKKQKESITQQFRKCGDMLLLADTLMERRSEARLVAQGLSLAAYGTYTTRLLKENRNKEILKIGDRLLKVKWLNEIGTPQQAVFDSITPKAEVSLDDYQRYHAEMWRDVVAAARKNKSWSAVVKYGDKALQYVPEPVNRDDEKLLQSRADLIYDVAAATIRLRKAEPCSLKVFAFYDFAQRKARMAKNPELLLSRAHRLDSLMRATKFEYLDFDNHGKVRAAAARAFDKLNDPERAYILYDESIDAGQKSINLYLGRMQAAVKMQDEEKMASSLDALKDKRTNGELNHDQEKEVREYEQMMKKR
jgi:hypothetical protein